MTKPFNPHSREMQARISNAKSAGANRQFYGNVRTAKGIGPNKACGHKGGITRQGSKR